MSGWPGDPGTPGRKHGQLSDRRVPAGRPELRPAQPRGCRRCSVKSFIMYSASATAALFRATSTRLMSVGGGVAAGACELGLDAGRIRLHARKVRRGRAADLRFLAGDLVFRRDNGEFW